MTEADWAAVRGDLPAEGIATGNATFETEAPPGSAWDAGHAPTHRLVARTTARRRLGGA